MRINTGLKSVMLAALLSTASAAETLTEPTPGTDPSVEPNILLAPLEKSLRSSPRLPQPQIKDPKHKWTDEDNELGFYQKAIGPDGTVQWDQGHRTRKHKCQISRKQRKMDPMKDCTEGYIAYDDRVRFADIPNGADIEGYGKMKANPKCPWEKTAYCTFDENMFGTLRAGESWSFTKKENRPFRVHCQVDVEGLVGGRGSRHCKSYLSYDEKIVEEWDESYEDDGKLVPPMV